MRTNPLQIPKHSFLYLKDFFEKHPLINPRTFLGDAAFDTIQVYHDLFYRLKFEKAYIPLKNKLALEDADCPLNEDGIPCCPHDPSFPMKREGSKTRFLFYEFRNDLFLFSYECLHGFYNQSAGNRIRCVIILFQNGSGFLTRFFTKYS